MDRPSTSRESNMDVSGDEPVDEITLKARYMILLEEVNCIEKNKVRNGIHGVKSILDEANKLLPQVRNTCNLFWDAQVLDSATAALEEITNNVDVGEGNFNLMEFSDLLRSNSLDNEDNPTFLVILENFEPVLNHISHTMPTYTPILAGLEAQEEIKKVNKERKRLQRDKIPEKKEPEKLGKVEKEKSGVEEIVQNIYGKLRKYYRDNGKNPIHFYKFVVNPKSFSATVENIFHVSFLVNDGHVKLDLDEEGAPLISPVSNSKGKENSNPENEESRELKQNILYMDMETWRTLIVALDIASPMI